MTWKIQAITGDFAGQEIIIDHDMSVGRHPSADIVLQAGEISRKHAAFLLKDGQLWVQDLNSSNGTFVNDIRIDSESIINNGDVVQFASLKFTVQPIEKEVEALTSILGAELQRVVVAEQNQEKVEAIQQPAEAVAVVEIKEEQPKTPAQEMNDQGMPELKERDSSVQLTRDGMPQGVVVPKPAPIPEGVDVTATTPEPQPIPVEQPVSRVEEEKEVQKNASVGLISVIILIILAILAWVFFK